MDIGVTDIVERLRATPLWKQAEREVHEDLAAERQAAASRLADAAKAHDKALPHLLKALERAQKERDVAWAAYLEAEAALGKARAAVTSAGLGLSAVRGREERFLRDTSDLRIDEFIRELELEHEQARRLAPRSSGGGKMNPVTGQFEAHTHSTLRAIREHLEGLREAWRQAAALKMEPDPDLDARFEEIRASIPSPDRLLPIEASDVPGRAA